MSPASGMSRTWERRYRERLRTQGEFSKLPSRRQLPHGVLDQRRVNAAWHAEVKDDAKSVLDAARSEAEHIHSGNVVGWSET